MNERTNWDTISMLSAYCDARMILDLPYNPSEAQQGDEQTLKQAAQPKMSKALIEAAGLAKKKQEPVASRQHKEAVKQLLEQYEILEKRNGQWRIADGMENVFRDIVYLARFREREAEVISETFNAAFELVKKTVHVGAVLHAATSLTKIIAVGVAADDICKYVHSFLTAPKTFEEMTDQEWKACIDWANSVIKLTEDQGKVSEDVLKLVKKDLKRIKQMANEYPNANFPFENSDGKSVYDLLSKPKLTDIIRDLIKYDHQNHAKLLHAFTDVYQEILPGELFPSRSNISPTIKEVTKRFSFQTGVTTIHFLHSLCAEHLFVGPQIVMNDLIQDMREGKHFLGRMVRLNPTVKDKLTNFLIAQTNNLDKAFERHSMHTATIANAKMQILKYNLLHAQQHEAHQRGLNFAVSISSLTLFRSGNGDDIKTWFKSMKMAQEDAAWAIAYLKAGMYASIDGVQFNAGKAMADVGTIIDQYRIEANRTNYDQLIIDFETGHRQLVTQCNEMRKEIGEPELQKQMFFDRRRDDMPIGDRLRWIDMTEQEYSKADLKKVLEQYDAIIVHDENYLYYMGKNEQGVVIGRKNSEGYLQKLDLVYAINPLQNGEQKLALEVCNKKSQDMEINYHITNVLRNNKSNSNNAEIYRILNQLINYGFKANSERRDEISFKRESLICTIKYDEINPEQAIQSFVNNTRNTIWNEMLKENNINPDEMQKDAKDMETMRNSGVNPQDSYVDIYQEYENLRRETQSLTQDDILNPDKYNDIVTELRHKMKTLVNNLTIQKAEQNKGRVKGIQNTTQDQVKKNIHKKGGRHGR